MNVGDLVTWSDEETQSKMPWYYYNWQEIGVVINVDDVEDPETVIIHWCSTGYRYPVWLTSLKLLSSNSSNKKLNLS